MDGTESSNREPAQKMGGFSRMKTGMPEGGMATGYVPVGAGISFIYEIKAAAQIIKNLTESL